MLEGIGRIAAGLQFGAPGAPKRVFDQLRGWIQHLTVSAVPKWVPHLALGMSCHVHELHSPTEKYVRCIRVSCGGCVLCRQATCLEHSFVASSGELVCYACVAKHAPPAPKPPAPPPPPPAGDAAPAAEPAPTAEEIAAARRELRVKRGATWEQIQAAHRQKVKVAHPDRGGTDEEFRRVQMAYQILKKVHESANGTG